MDKTGIDTANMVRSEIKQVAHRLERNFNSVLIDFGLERVLFRLSKSRFRQSFVLKGGMLMSLWSADLGRISHDLDILAFANNDEEELESIFSEILSIELEDGLLFDLNGISTSKIMLNEEYHGIRIKLPMRLKKTETHISVDVGFGDALPHPKFEIDYPSILNFEPARVRAYSRETVVAEKFHTIIKFGGVNTRMKDYYDLWVLLHDPNVRKKELAVAVNAAFKARGATVPRMRPYGLSQEFAAMPNKIVSWTNYSKNTKLSSKPLSEVVEEISVKLEAVQFE